MPRRVSLPGADDLFRPTDGEAPRPRAVPDPQPAEAPPTVSEPGDRRSSGRVRHDEKMTVYVTADELFALEQTRLVLRREHGVAVDRGRLVRAAVALALADLDERGADSDLVRRLAVS